MPAGAILRFVEEHTVHVEGVGDVCSLAAFDFARHGNAKYGAPSSAPKVGGRRHAACRRECTAVASYSHAAALAVPASRPGLQGFLCSACLCTCVQAARSRQGKMEKSFLGFAAAYPQWEPPEGAPRQFLAQLAAQSQQLAAGAGGAGAGLARGGGAAASALLLQQQLQGPPGGAASLAASQQLLQGWLGRYQKGGPGSSGIFASAELPEPAGWGSPPAAAHLHQQQQQPPPQQQQQPQHGLGLAQLQAGLGWGPLGVGMAVGEAAERVAISQLLLQVCGRFFVGAPTRMRGGWGWISCC